MSIVRVNVPDDERFLGLIFNPKGEILSAIGATSTEQQEVSMDTSEQRQSLAVLLVASAFAISPEGALKILAYLGVK